MAVYLSAGVYAREIDLSLYVSALSSTAVGMVGVASKGPINEPTFISDAVQFTSIFGEPVVSTDANGVSTPESYAAYAAVQYLTQGRQLYFNRVAATDPNGVYTAHKSHTTIYENATAATLLGIVRGSATVATSNNILAFVFGTNLVTNFVVQVPVPIPDGLTSQAFSVTQLVGILNNNSAFARWATASVNVDPLPAHASKNGVIKIELTQLGSNYTLALDGSGTANATVFGAAPEITAGVGSVYAASQLFSVNLFSSGVGVGHEYQIPSPSGDLTLSFYYNIASRVNEQVIISDDLATASLTNGHVFPGKVVGQKIVIGSQTVVVDSLSASGTTAVLGTVTSAPLVAGSYNFNYACVVVVTINTAGHPALLFPYPSDVAYFFNNLVSSTISESFRDHFTATAVGTQVVFVPIDHAGASTHLQVSATATSLPNDLDYGEELFGVGSGTPPVVKDTDVGQVAGTTPVALLDIEALTEGTWGNVVSVGIENVSPVGSVARNFDLVVYYKGNVVERYNKCVRYPSNLGYDAHGIPTSNPKYIETITSGSSFVSVTDLQKDVSTYFATLPLHTNAGVTVTLSGGNNGAPDSYDVAPFIGTVDGTTKTGLQVFASAEDLDINLLMVPGIYDAAVLNAIITISVNRADCMGILDCPRDFVNNRSLTPQQVVDWHNGQGVFSDHAAFNSSYAAVYWPWLQLYDAINGVKVWCPPSGFMAGVYAYSDNTTEVWFAPAGLNRGHLTSPMKAEYSPSLGERDLLYGNGNAINPIATFKQDGINVWGQRTLQRLPTALDRVNVRRTLLYLEKVLVTAVRGLLFEPNDPATWVQFRRLITPTLEGIKNRRGLNDYKVVCDATINTPDVIEQNMMKANIFVKPMKTVEMIQLNFIITSQGSSFTEQVF